MLSTLRPFFPGRTTATAASPVSLLSVSLQNKTVTTPTRQEPAHPFSAVLAAANSSLLSSIPTTVLDSVIPVTMLGVNVSTGCNDPLQAISRPTLSATRSTHTTRLVILLTFFLIPLHLPFVGAITPRLPQLVPVVTIIDPSLIASSLLSNLNYGYGSTATSCSSMTLGTVIGMMPTPSPTVAPTLTTATSLPITQVTEPPTSPAVSSPTPAPGRTTIKPVSSLPLGNEGSIQCSGTNISIPVSVPTQTPVGTVLITESPFPPEPTSTSSSRRSSIHRTSSTEVPIVFFPAQRASSPCAARLSGMLVLVFLLVEAYLVAG